MQHIIIPHFRLPQIHSLNRCIHRPQIHRVDRHRLPTRQRILAFHPDVRATRAAEVPVDGLDARRIVAELRAGGRGVQDEVGGGGEGDDCCAEALAEGAVAAGGGEVALGVEGDVGCVGYEAGLWG